MPNINLANVAVDECEGRPHGIERHTNITRPFIDSTTRNGSDNAMLSLRIHHPVDNLVQRTITTIGYDQVSIRFRSPGRQGHTMSTILFDTNVRVPASRRQDGNNISEPCYVLTRPGVNYQRGFLALHRDTPYDSASRATASSQGDRKGRPYYIRLRSSA